MSVETRYYASLDSARRALRKWGIGATDYRDFVKIYSGGHNAPPGKPYGVSFGKDGPIQNNSTQEGDIQLPSELIDVMRREQLVGEDQEVVSIGKLIEEVEHTAYPTSKKKARTSQERKKRREARRQRVKQGRKRRGK